MGGSINAGATLVDVAVAVVVDRVAGFGSGRSDVAEADAPVTTGGAGLETARANAEVGAASSGRPGRADAVLVGVAVAVLVEQVTADLGSGSDEADAEAPTAARTSLGSAGTFTGVVLAGLGRTVHAGTALVHFGVAVVVQRVTGLGDRGSEAQAAAVGPLAGSEAVVQAGPRTHGTLAKVSTARFGHADGAQAPFVHRAVAVVVHAVADLGVGGDARAVAPESANAELGTERALAHLLAAETRRCSNALAAFVDRGVAVVIRAVAGFGVGADTKAKAPIAAHTVLDTSSADADVRAADATIFVDTFAVLVDGPVAVVVRAVAVLRGHDAA